MRMFGRCMRFGGRFTESYIKKRRNRRIILAIEANRTLLAARIVAYLDHGGFC